MRPIHAVAHSRYFFGPGGLKRQMLIFDKIHVIGLGEFLGDLTARNSVCHQEDRWELNELEYLELCGVV